MYTIVEQCALHYQDNLWAACYTTDGQYQNLRGIRDKELLGSSQQLDDIDSACRYFQRKVADKMREHYQPIPFSDPARAVLSFNKPVSSTPATRFINSPIIKASIEQLPTLINSRHYGLTEKVSGERCLITAQQGVLNAYNHYGRSVKTVPSSLKQLKHYNFVIDGQRYGQDCYAIFDVLELNGQKWQNRPYSERAAALANWLSEENIPSGHWLPQAQPLYGLLPTQDPETAWLLTCQLKAHQREGYILRALQSNYAEGGYKHEFRYTLNAVVLSSQANRLSIGLYHENGQLLPVAHLTNSFSQTRLTSSQQPVIVTVSYLPYQSVGSKLAEPAFERICSDKNAAQCTTRQIKENHENTTAQATP